MLLVCVCVGVCVPWFMVPAQVAELARDTVVKILLLIYWAG